MTFKQIEKLLRKNGWTVKDISGSHYQFIHPKQQNKISVPNHSGDIPIGTVNKILKDAGLK